MKASFDPALAEKAFHGVAVDSHGAPIVYKVLKLGRLALPSGRIIAADPFLAPGADAFERVVPAGRYPASIAVATLFSEEKYVAFARLRFSDSAIVCWEPARVARAAESAYEGYGVDSGVGCFVDADLAGTYAAALEDGGALERKISSKLDRAGGALLRASFWSRGNLACFSSGRGDGIYSSHFGIDASGRPATLITDFRISNTFEPASMGAWEIQKALQHGGELRDRVMKWLNDR